jgi:hypothetical protein
MNQPSRYLASAVLFTAPDASNRSLAGSIQCS